jgi:hypothetical protein
MPKLYTDEEIQRLKYEAETLSREYLEACFTRHEAAARASSLLRANRKVHAEYLRARGSLRPVASPTAGDLKPRG